MADNVIPFLGYGNSEPNSGHSGSDTSKTRAQREDSDGTTGQRQGDTLRFLAERGEAGATWGEVSTLLGIHHGAASGALSNLHKSGLVSRLTEVRNKSKVYVLTKHVNGRPTEEQGNAATHRLIDRMAALLDEATPESCQNPDHATLPDLYGCWVCRAHAAVSDYQTGRRG